MHALYFGERMARQQSAFLLANPLACEARGAPADGDQTTRQAHEQEERSCKWPTQTNQQAELPFFYAFAALASSRAVLVSHFLRNSSRCLSTKALASSKLA